MHRTVPVLHVLLYLLLFVWRTATSQESENTHVPSLGLENSPLTTVQAAIGQSVLLPCDVTATNSADAPILVLFYYGSKGTPIYSVDARNSSLYSGEQWSDADQLGNRASVRLQRTGPQGLHLSKLVAEDSGQYRCRVDFRSSPTKNFRILLDIISPPRHILITSSWDEGRVVEGVIGPYPEGADLTLTCQVTGGDPPPSVTWWQGGSLLDRHCEVKTPQVTSNALRLSRLTRDDLLRKFTCTAANSNITAPLSSAVAVDIALPPSSVRIWLQNNKFQQQDHQDSTASIDSSSSGFSTMTHHHSNEKKHSVLTVREGKEAYLACEAYGSRPQAFLLWKKNNRVIVNSDVTTQASFMARRRGSSSRGATMTSSQGDAASLSSLTIVPTADDNKATLGCAAYSPKLPDETLEDEVSLNVLYRPRITLSFDSILNSTSLEVGDPFALLCNVDSNPPPGAIQWAKDGVPITPSPSMTMKGPRLEVSHSTRPLTGRYTCAAANSEGANTSRPLHLRVKFDPVCTDYQKTQYGAGIKEGVDVSCSVESYPVPLTFRWAFNSSSNIVDIPQSSYSSSGVTSTVRYTPHTVLDFGTLLCWASNDVGLMKEPCVINIVPAAKPEPVKNCRVLNNSSMPRSVALVTCSSGYDGGLNQTFSLEVRALENLHSRKVADVQHSPIPVFHLKGLKLGEEFLFIVTAVNSRGTSPPVTMSYSVPSAVTSSLASYSYDGSKSTWISWTLFIGVIFSALITALICFCVALFVLKFKKPKKNKNTAKMVYAGPIRNHDEKDKFATLEAHDILHCGKPGCEEEKLVKVDYVQSDCGPMGMGVTTLPRVHYTDHGRPNNATLQRVTVADPRRTPSSSPRGWINNPHCPIPDGGDPPTYVRSPGYHTHSLSPPPLPHPSSLLQRLSPTDECTQMKTMSPEPSLDSLSRSSSSSQPSSFNTSSSNAATSSLTKDDDGSTTTCMTPLMSASSSLESAV